MSLKRTLRRTHGLATRYAPTEVTVYRISYAAVDDPYDTGQQFTYTTHRVRGIFAPRRTAHEPVEAQSTSSGIVTITKSALGFVPSEADRLEVGGVVYNIVSVDVIEGAIIKCDVSGPAPEVV